MDALIKMYTKPNAMAYSKIFNGICTRKSNLLNIDPKIPKNYTHDIGLMLAIPHKYWIF